MGKLWILNFLFLYITLFLIEIGRNRRSLVVLVGYVLGLFPTSQRIENTSRVRRELIPNF